MSAGPEEIAAAVTRLRAGGVVAFPTETVYGLGADALNARAIARVFELKGRPAHNPLIVHVSDEAMARAVAMEWPDAAGRLALAFWPGPLTLVLPKRPVVPDAVTAGGPTVAVRCPAHHLTLSLLSTFGGPLVGPSANPSGSISPTTAEHVRQAFREEDVLVLDGGPCRGGIESTVLSLAEPVPRVLRAGLISPDEIEIVLGQAVEGNRPADGASTAPLQSPGQLPVHYAPRARAVLLDIAALNQTLLQSRQPIVVLSITLANIGSPHTLIRMPADPTGYAARLYAALHEADNLRPSLIAIERPPTAGAVWEAIADRLTRATSRAD